MDHNLITHVICESLPKSGFKQVSFICSTKAALEKSQYFSGYSGARVLSKKDLTSNSTTTFYELPVSVEVVEEWHVWLNPTGDIFLGMIGTDSTHWQKIGNIKAPQ